MRSLLDDLPLKVAGDILSLAARSSLRRGDRLPTERDLASELQLSRTTIRNAMALLEDEGMVSRQVGRGTFLRSDPQNGVISASPSARRLSIDIDVSPTDVMAARWLIEPAVIASVVENATINDFDEIERCLRGNEGAVDYDEVEMWDLALHRAIVRAAHNPLMAGMYSLV